MSCCKPDNHVTGFSIDKENESIKLSLKNGLEFSISKAEMCDFLSSCLSVSIENPVVEIPIEKDPPVVENTTETKTCRNNVVYVEEVATKVSELDGNFHYFYKIKPEDDFVFFSSSSIYYLYTVELPDMTPDDIGRMIQIIKSNNAYYAGLKLSTNGTDLKEPYYATDRKEVYIAASVLTAIYTRDGWRIVGGTYNNDIGYYNTYGSDGVSTPAW